jgi:hypothetical protein
MVCNDYICIAFLISRELADQDQDGNLDEEEFVLAMYLINAKLRGTLPVIPQEVLPEFRITYG